MRTKRTSNIKYIFNKQMKTQIYRQEIVIVRKSTISMVSVLSNCNCILIVTWQSDKVNISFDFLAFSTFSWATSCGQSLVLILCPFSDVEENLWYIARDHVAELAQPRYQYGCLRDWSSKQKPSCAAPTSSHNCELLPCLRALLFPWSTSLALLQSTAGLYQ